ncbi:histidine phosphatase family protein [Paenibacillus sp. 2TAB23]|uniref:histidine phosphatase family protein n=1 Tax=Paenibacillus sp. 2TAB23 TaxID=3233004 RepID=UPI003F963EB8
MKNIYIVRHCKATGQEASAPLTESGAREAEQLAAFFLTRDIDHVISSPYERAYRSIKPLADRLGMEIVLDDRLTERVLTTENSLDWLEKLSNTYDDLELRFEGGETSNEAMRRAVPVVLEASGSGYSNVVIVSHGNLISLILNHFDSRIGFKEWQAMSNPDVFQLSFAGDEVKLERIWAE